MRIEVHADPPAVARRGAELIRRAAAEAVRARGRFVFATSAGRTPWQMLAMLAELPMPWSDTHLFQVDERVVPLGDPFRNLSQLTSALLARVPLPQQQVHAMPVEMTDLAAAAAAYAGTLRRLAGDPPRLDLIHLGLGGDGHTASLFAGDPACDAPSAGVTVTEVHEGRRRLTLAVDVLEAARTLLWVVTGAEKAGAIGRMVSGDRTIPAGRVRSEHAVLLVDEAAARSI